MTKPIIGHTYARWTVLDGPFRRGAHRNWLCRCECGTEKEVREQHLVSKASNGCSDCREYGYKLAGVSKKVFTKLSHVVEHAIARCTDETNPKYSDYGGRGIKVRFSDKVSFIEYLLTLPGHDDFSLVIDRINNDGHYEPGNLRFTTHSMSAQNRRPQMSEKRYYDQYGFSRCFRKLRDKGVSLRKIAELYCTSYGMILRCTIQG